MFEPSTIFNPASWMECAGRSDLSGSVPSWIAPRHQTSHVTGSLDPTRPPPRAASSSPAHEQVVAPAAELPSPKVPISTSEPEPTVAAAELERAVAESEQLRTQLAATVRSVSAIRRKLLEEAETELVRLSLVIAEKVVDRELGTDPSLVERWARAAIDKLTEDGQTEIAISEDLAASLPTLEWVADSGHPLAPVVDPSLPAGSCVVRDAVSRVDCSATARLAAVREALCLEEATE